MDNDEFWVVVEAQLDELRTATTSADVLRILSNERSPYGPGVSSGQGFFAGSGGDGSVEASLQEAGWEHVWREAHYYWVMQAPNGDRIKYVEGDIFAGDQARKR